MLEAVRHLRRMVTVARTLARYNALFPLQKTGAPGWVPRLLPLILAVRRDSASGGLREGERLARACATLGPAFVKIGQALSVRPDLIGDDIANDLSTLQDRMPAFDGQAARDAIEGAFGAPVATLFATFDDDAVAAASIAQVHRATDSDGNDVAVKVLRPGIEDAFARDMALARWVAAILERRVPELRRLRPVEAVETIIRSVEMELDLRFEAAAADELRQNFDDEPGFDVPTVDWSRTAERVLTTRWIDAVPIGEIDRLETLDADDRTAIVANFAKVFFLQVFRDGFFHADLHPGNLFVDGEGTVHAVDFGIMGRLDRRTRQYLAEMLHGFLTGDYRRVADVHIRAGYVPTHHSAEEFAQAARSIAEPILGLPLGEISLARLLAQLFAVTRKFDMEAQPQLLLLQKTMLVAEGVGRRLCPDVNMWELARPLIEDWMREHMGAEARIRDAIEDVLDGLERLPQLIADMEESIAAVSRDGLKIDTGALARGQDRRGVFGAAWPVWATAIAIAVLGIVVFD